MNMFIMKIAECAKKERDTPVEVIGWLWEKVPA